MKSTAVLKSTAAMWRLVICSVTALVLFALLLSAMAEPVKSRTHTYTAQFTDISGLQIGADVRVRGVLAGRVVSTTLEHSHGQSVAAVQFTLDTKFAVAPDTRLAVKFQTLTGARYIDVIKPADGDVTTHVVTMVPTAMTQASFDVTRLFNGLQPVFATVSPEHLDAFAANVANFLAGDGGGLAPVLESMHKLTRFLADREQVVATLMHNLANVADTMGGHAADFAQIVRVLNEPLDQALTVLDEFRKSDLFGPEFAEPAWRLVNNIGFENGDNDLDRAFDTAFNNLDRTFDAFKLIPAMWENIPAPVPAGELEPCARGPKQLPATMDVLLNGRRVVLCNR